MYKSVCSLCAVLPALHAKHAINGHLLRRMLLKLRFPAASTPTRFRTLLLFFLGEPTLLPVWPDSYLTATAFQEINTDRLGRPVNANERIDQSRQGHVPEGFTTCWV